MSLPRRVRQGRRCLVCGGKLVWPSLYFDRAACTEAWIAKAREREPVLMGKEKA